MNSHQRRVANRIWQARNAEEIGRVCALLAGPKHFELDPFWGSDARDSSLITMREGFAAFGSKRPLPAAHWRAYLRDRGIMAAI